MPKFKELINLPPEPEGGAEEQLAALRDYLVKIIQELQYLLSHLEPDNINDSTFQQIYRKIPKPYDGLPLMDGAASSGGSGSWARGDHRHPHDMTKADATALAEVAEDLEDTDAALAGHVTDTDNPHEVTKAQVGLGNVADERQYSVQNPPPTPSAADVGAIPITAKGSAGGVAELDAGGMVPSAQLPSYVDDVLEYPTAADFPATGENGKIYVALDTNRTYRWSGSAYVEISESLALGETSSTAYRGDRGKTAYDHSQTAGNPHGTTAADVGARPDTWTPSKSDIGLGNVANERQYSANNPPPLPTPGDIGAVPESREINGYPLDTDVTIDAIDVGARPDTWTPSKSDIGLGNVANERQYSAQNPPPLPDAEDIIYDNMWSGLAAIDVQAAIDELAQSGGGPSPSDASPQMDGLAAPGTATTYSRADHVHPSDTTKANQAQLAVVETGATASAAHAAGEYFCWNGLLYRATAAILVGQSFTPGTNCYQTTAMDMAPPRINGGDLNDYTTPGLYMWPATAATMPTNVPLAAQSVMIVLQASSADRVCQIVFAHDATRNGVFYRWLFSNAWTSWYTIG